MKVTALIFFGPVLTRDLLDWHYPEVTFFQYVDGLLLCRATEPLICRVTESLLNFLATESLKKKAPLGFLKVTYLGVALKGQAHALSHEISKSTQSSISHSPIP
jgi:hypothetical protein